MTAANRVQAVRKALKFATDTDFVELRKAVEAGDTRARDDLILIVYEIGTPFAMLSCGADEELTHVALERVVSDILDGALQRWQPKVPFPQWVRGLVRGRIGVERRRPRDDVISLSGIDPETAESDEPGPEEAYELRERVANLGELLSDLEADALALSVAGFSARECAEVLGTTENGVVSAITRARSKGKGTNE